MKRLVILLACCGVGLVACDRAAPRQARLAPRPPGLLETAPAPPPPPAAMAANKPPAPIIWDKAKGAFTFQGKALRAEKLWTFDGATDGFVATGGEVQPGASDGMAYREVANDPVLRSPKGLNVEGRERSLVLVRLTRTQPGRLWDGTVFYTTATHGESANYQAKPVFGGDPAVGETETLVFDMGRSETSSADWRASIIEQIRIDLDDAAGGEFVIRQIAIAQAPPGLVPAAAP